MAFDRVRDQLPDCTDRYHRYGHIAGLRAGEYLLCDSAFQAAHVSSDLYDSQDDNYPRKYLSIQSHHQRMAVVCNCYRLLGHVLLTL